MISKDLLIASFFVFLVGFKENLVWSLQIQIKCTHYASRGCELLKLHVHGTLESDPWQILFLLWFVSRMNPRAPWRLTFLYQRKLFLLLEASFKDWFHVNVVFHRVENRKPWKKTKKQETLFQVYISVKNRTTSCRLHSQQKTQSVQIIHILSLIAAVLIWLVICFFTFDIFLWFHCTCKKMHQIIKPQSLGRTKKNMWTTKTHHLWRHQTQLVFYPLNRTVYSRGEWPVYLAVTWWKLENQPQQPWNTWILGALDLEIGGLLSFPNFGFPHLQTARVGTSPLMMWGKSSSTRSCHKKNNGLDVDHTPYSICIPITSVFPTKHKWRESNQKIHGKPHRILWQEEHHDIFCYIFLSNIFVGLCSWGSHCLGSKTSEISMKSDGTSMPKLRRGIPSCLANIRCYHEPPNA